MEIKYAVIIGGSPQARERWPIRKYRHKSSAKRRGKQIASARDSGVETIWICHITEAIHDA